MRLLVPPPHSWGGRRGGGAPRSPELDPRSAPTGRVPTPGTPPRHVALTITHFIFTAAKAAPPPPGGHPRGRARPQGYEHGHAPL